MAEIHKFPMNESTVEGVLQITERAKLESVVTLGWYPDGTIFICATKNLSRKDALWLLEGAKIHLLDIALRPST